MELLSSATLALLAGTEAAEVLGALGRDGVEELEDDAALGLATDGHVEENIGVIGLEHSQAL